MEVVVVVSIGRQAVYAQLVVQIRIGMPVEAVTGSWLLQGSTVGPSGSSFSQRGAIVGARMPMTMPMTA